MLTTVFLRKAACFIHLKQRPAAKVADGLRRPSASVHSITLTWGPEFADRFSAEEADVLWQRFQRLDALLQADEEQFVPGFQSGPMRYYFNEMPADFSLAEFTASPGRSDTQPVISPTAAEFLLEAPIRGRDLFCIQSAPRLRPSAISPVRTVRRHAREPDRRAALAGLRETVQRLITSRGLPPWEL